MRISLKILIFGIILLAPMANGQLGSLGDFDGVLQAKFALKIAEADSTEDVNFTFTSSALIREYALPASARVYWVFDFDGPLIQGGMVMADQKTGKIYAVVAEARQVADEEFVDEDVDPGAFEDIGIGAFLTARFNLLFEIDGLEILVSPLIEFQFIQGGRVSFLRLNSLVGLEGMGYFNDGSPLLVTDGHVAASGTIVNFN